MLKFADGEPFTVGQCSYSYRSISEQSSSLRIFVPIKVQDIPVEAMLDTGGLYFICTPELAEELHLSPEDGLLQEKLMIRGVSIPGYLHRINVEFLAQEGESFVLDVVAFIPDTRFEDDSPWPFPAYLGMQGCLELMRFALDPGKETFHFGPISQE